MELTNLQNEIVEKLLSEYRTNRKTKVDFKAPTGSGKTLIATSFISKLILSYPEKNFVFVIATPSSSSLPLFFEEKINQYKRFLDFNDFEAEYIKSPSDNKSAKKEEGTHRLYPEKNKVYIFGKSSFGKGRILSTHKIIDDFVSSMENRFSLIYIRDEAHIGEGVNTDNGSVAFETLMCNNAEYVLKMTATPNYKDSSVKRIILSEEDLNDREKNMGKYLLKTTGISLLDKDMSDDEMLREGIERFKKIKEEYSRLEKETGVYIRPALLIQVDNDSYTDKEKNRLFNEALSKIKKTLDDNALSFAVYFGDNKKDSNTIYKGNFTLSDLTPFSSDIDAIIFKIGPSTGWDIPRACMLLQLRSVTSEGFNTQTIGRIKRNPFPGLEKNEITDKYYIYSNTYNTQKDEYYTLNVKDGFKDEEFLSVEITNKKVLSEKLSKDNLKEELFQYLENNKDKIIQEAKAKFLFKDGVLTYQKIIKRSERGNEVRNITNAFSFIIDAKKLKEKNDKIFNPLEKLLLSFYNENYKEILLYNKEKYPRSVSFTLDFFFVVLLEEHRSDLLNIIKKNSQYQPFFKVKSQKYIPEIKTSPYRDDMKLNKVLTDHYLFSVKWDDKNKEYQIPLDSSPEFKVFGILQSKDSNNKKIKLWCKNQTTSNVNGAYLDEYNNIHYSYFDFIIKFSNGILLYIEVKGEEDIDEEKTRMLERAYDEYFKDEEACLFPKMIVISLWNVYNDGHIQTRSFYNKRTFNGENLNQMKADELLDFLGDF